MLHCINADVDVLGLLDLGGFDLARINVEGSQGAEEHSHHHDNGIVAYSFMVPSPLDFECFEQWVGSLLRDAGDNLYRMKGILRMSHTDNALILQGVRALYNWRYGNPWQEEEQGRIVFIGRGLDRAEIADGLQRCVASNDRLLSEP